LENNVVLWPGVRIGQDGFGFHPAPPTTKGAALGGGQVHKKPQELRVRIGAHVEIGANSTIDRGSWRDTCIGAHTKLDNMVHIAHNVVIGCASVSVAVPCGMCASRVQCVCVCSVCVCSVCVWCVRVCLSACVRVRVCVYGNMFFWRFFGHVSACVHIIEIYYILIHILTTSIRVHIIEVYYIHIHILTTSIHKTPTHTSSHNNKKQ
jgi:hypothetical protein